MHGPQDGEAGEAALAEQPAPAMLESALASTTKGKGNSGKLQPGIGDEAYVAGGENRHQSGTGKLAGADWQMQPDIAQLQPCAEIHEVCANHPKKSTTDVTLQNNACNYPGGEVVNSVPELHHQHKEPHHVGMDDSMVQVERETRVLKKKVTSAHSVEDEVYADHPKMPRRPMRPLQLRPGSSF